MYGWVITSCTFCFCAARFSRLFLYLWPLGGSGGLAEHSEATMHLFVSIGSHGRRWISTFPHSAQRGAAKLGRQGFSTLLILTVVVALAKRKLTEREAAHKS